VIRSAALHTLDDTGNFEHPAYNMLLKTPGLSVFTVPLDALMTWGATNALWMFPMATSCCGIELMAVAASRVDVDRMGTIVRGTPRQADVMVIAGTITTKMAPRVLRLWEQMPEPKWSIAMGSCAISGDFYRELYSVVPGVDTFMPVDVYVPGCPPNPEALMNGLLTLQQKIRDGRKGEAEPRPVDLNLLSITKPSVPRVNDPARAAEVTPAQHQAATVATDMQQAAPLAVASTTAPAATPLAATDFDALLVEMGVAVPKDGPPLVPADRHRELARRLQDLGHRIYVSVIATHFPAGRGRKGDDKAETEHFEVVTILRTVGKGSRTATWAVRLEPGQALDSLAGVFAGADWQEREQWDLVGVPFAGHPDLRRLMMAENFQGHPLRRDFASDAAAPPWR